MLNYLEKSLRPYLVSLTSLEEMDKDITPLSIVQAEEVDTKESLEMCFYEPAKYLQNHIYSTPPVYSKILNKVIYCPPYNVLLTRSRKIISDSISTSKDKKIFNIKSIYSHRVIKKTGFYSTFRSVGRNNYYHTIIDNLPRLYLLNTPKYQNIKEIKILCAYELTKAEKFFLNKLLPQNATIEVVDNNTLYLTDKFIFNSFLTSRFSGYLSSNYLDFFQDKFNPKRTRKKTKRIFISRVKSKHKYARCLLNEDELVNILEKYGFQKYILENLSIEEQINLFYDAECVVAAHGAGLTNIIFSDQIKVLEIHPMQSIIPHFYYLSKSLGHSYYYWCGQEKDRDSNFMINLSEVEKIVKDKILNPQNQNINMKTDTNYHQSIPIDPDLFNHSSINQWEI